MEPQLLVLVLLVVTIGLVIALITRPAVTRDRGGRILAFAAVFLLPALCLWVGFNEHMHRSKSKDFCLSCHVMQDYGKSLMVDDEEYIPAVHYQNNFVPRESACFTCHTDYTLYGDYKAKFRGLRHLIVNVTHSYPDTLKLYTPYNNRECLHCHNGARKFESVGAHKDTDTTMVAIKTNKLSCISSGCHDVTHDVKNLKDVEFWKGGDEK